MPANPLLLKGDRFIFYSYAFDPLGNLRRREDHDQSLVETFDYVSRGTARGRTRATRGVFSKSNPNQRTIHAQESVSIGKNDPLSG